MQAEQGAAAVGFLAIPWENTEPVKTALDVCLARESEARIKD
jgi:hypothetical protein